MSGARYLSFVVEGVEYALEAVSVREILALPPITRVPGTPSHVRGVVNRRGNILPVVDLRIRLGIQPDAPPPTDHAHTSVVVIESAAGSAGLIVDEVNAMLEIRPHQLRSPAGSSLEIDGGLVRAVADLGDRSPLLLNPDRLTGRDL